jgi:hypothetical protein
VPENLVNRLLIYLRTQNCMKHKIKFALAAIIMLVAACTKKTADTPLPVVPERLEITPLSSSIKVGETAQFTLKFFNNTGQPAAVPSGITWSSVNTSIATVNQSGIASGAGAGQTEIKASYNTISATALLTVVTNNTQLASVIITPVDIQEVKLNETATLIAVGKNNAGEIIPGLTFSWQSNNTALVEVNGSGTVTGKAYGTSDITASSLNIQSAPVMVQVIRKGSFSGMNSAGIAKLKIENGILKLQTTADFSVSAGPPDLRIYLSNVNNSISNALEVASLNQRTGAQSWNVPASGSITQYRYVIVWCKQFGGTYGIVDLGI